MDGRTAIGHMIQALDGNAGGDKLELFSALDAAATDFVRQTKLLTSEVDITTTEDGQEYDLPPDFIALYVRDAARRLVGKFYDGSTTTWPVLTTYEKIFRANKTDSKAVPTSFAIRDMPTLNANITGTATAAGAAVGGECILTASGASFSGNANVRDIIHNTLDRSTGRVLAVTDDTHLVTTLFNGGADAWAENDTYVIKPAVQKQLVLEAPAETAGYTLTLPYLCMPAPVFSDFSSWRFEPRSCLAVCHEAAYLFQMHHKHDPRKDATLHNLFLQEIRRIKIEKAGQLLQGGRYTARA